MLLLESRKVAAPTVRGHLSSATSSKAYKLLIVSGPLSVVHLNAALLWGAAAVVGERGDVFDAGDFETGVLKIEDGLFAAGAGTFYFYFHFQETMFTGLLSGLLGGATGGEWGALASALESNRAGRCPGEGFAIEIGDGHHGVVEGRFDVGDAARDAFANFLLGRCFGAWRQFAGC